MNQQRPSFTEYLEEQNNTVEHLSGERQKICNTVARVQNNGICIKMKLIIVDNYSVQVSEKMEGEFISHLESVSF